MSTCMAMSGERLTSDLDITGSQHAIRTMSIRPNCRLLDRRIFRDTSESFNLICDDNYMYGQAIVTNSSLCSMVYLQRTECLAWLILWILWCQSIWVFSCYNACHMTRSTNLSVSVPLSLSLLWHNDLLFHHHHHP